MKCRRIFFTTLGLFIGLSCFAQIEITHSQPKNDSVWYTLVTEDSQPKPLSCQAGQTGYYRLKFSSEIVIKDFKTDTIETNKEDWEDKDEKEFDEEYNKKKKDELEELNKHFIEEDIDIDTQCKDELDRYMDVKWNGYRFNICKLDCESLIEECYVYHEITLLKDIKKEYKYKTSFSWLEVNDEGPNKVEIEFDLVITYEAWIFFRVTCSCNEIPDLMSVHPENFGITPNPWSEIEMVGTIMKPGYPFVVQPIKESSFPYLTVGLGGVGIGTAIYLLTGEDKEEDCSFTSTYSSISTECGDQSGSATVSNSQVANYSYLWSTGQTGSAISNLAAGTYQVTITRNNTACSNILNVVIEDDILTPQVSLTTINADCGETNGSAEITNPQSNHLYQWSDGSNGSSISNLAAGTYTLELIQGTSCFNSIELIIDENEPNFTNSFDFVTPDCGEQNGSITVSTAPAGEYTYEWSNGTTSPLNSDLSADTYNVTITKSGSDCSITETVELEEGAVDFNLDFNTTQATCGAMDATASVLVDQPGTYTILWSTGDTEADLSDLGAGTYSVTVTKSGTECSAEGTVNIEEKPLELDISFEQISAHCGLADGQLMVEVNPDGNYTFEWSNGDVGQSISGLTEGEYELTVIDEHGCTATGSTTLLSDPIIYLQSVSTESATCQGGGEIVIELTTPGSGPITLVVIGPNETFNLSVAAGVHELSTEFNILPGDYTIEMYDQGAGSLCGQSIDLTVVDNTPLIEAKDDMYETEYETTVSGNVLSNDVGLDIEVNGSFNIAGGTLILQNNGVFDFSPSTGFSGQASFNYIVADACEKLDTALVLIEVGSAICDFTVTFNIQAASCGLNDGEALVIVNEPGNYSFIWSNGNSNAFLYNVGGGIYTVMVIDDDKGCFIEYTVEINENPPNNISYLEVVQPTCTEQGEIYIELTSSSNGPFFISISHPNGINQFVLASGTTALSDLIEIVSGIYDITVYDTNAGAECSEGIVVTIDPSPGPVIAVSQIIQPSSMTSNDGVIVVQVINPSLVPYTIWLNGSFWGVTTEQEIYIEGLTVGNYTIYIQDQAGCVSNELSVSLVSTSLVSIVFESGFGMSLLETFPQTIEHLKADQPFISYQEFNTIFHFNRVAFEHRWKVYASLSGHQFSNTNLMQVANFDMGNLTIGLNGGFESNFLRDGSFNSSWVTEVPLRWNIIGPLSALAQFALVGNEAIDFRWNAAVRLSLNGFQHKNRF